MQSWDGDFLIHLSGGRLGVRGSCCDRRVARLTSEFDLARKLASSWFKGSIYALMIFKSLLPVFCAQVGHSIEFRRVVRYQSQLI